MAQDRMRVTVNSPQTGHTIGPTHTFGSSAGAGGASTTFGMTNTQTLSDSISQSRPHYRPGYLLSLSQNENSPAQTGGQRHDESFIIPTRAKLNPAFTRTTTSEFGSESMFESASKHRHRDAADDEDGPPAMFVSDLINDAPRDTFRSKSQVLSIKLRSSLPQPNQASLSTSANQTLFVVVFGYPQPRYSLTVAHFEALAAGGTIKAELENDVENAFKIGFIHPWEAARALRRNGEIISGEGGRWVVGVKWADPLAAQQILGAGAAFGVHPSSTSPEALDHTANPMDFGFIDQALVVSTSQTSSLSHNGTNDIGTPIQLAPSSSAFRRAIHEVKGDPVQQILATQQGTPSKGVIGQVSDLIFGW